MTVNHNKTHLSTPALLDLAMSIGVHPVFEENAKSFVTCLLKTLDLELCEIWCFHYPDPGVGTKVYQHSKSITSFSHVAKDHQLFTFHNDKNYEVISLDKRSHKAFESVCEHKTGIVYKIKVSATKVLFLYETNTNVPLSQKTLELLNPLAIRFGISIHQQFTNLKLASGALNYENELLKYKSVVENVSEGLLIVDNDFTVTYVNDFLCELTEFERDDVIGKSVLDISIDKSKVPFIKKMIQDTILGNEAKFTLQHTKNKSKEKWWADIKLSPYKNEHDEVQGGIAIVRDITEKHHAQLELEDSKERLDKLFNLTPIPILIRSTDSMKFKRVNKKFTELFGYTVEELEGLERKDLVHNENKEFITQEMKRLMNGEISVFRSEKQYIKKDKSVFWGAATRSLVKFEDENLLIGFIEDITAQKEAIAALRANEAKIRAIIDSSADKILALDLDYKLIDYNQSAKTFFRKFSSKTFKRGKIFEPDDEQIKSEWYSYFKKVLKGKDFTLTRKYNYESKERVDLINILPIKDDQGEVIGITIYGKEITEITNIQKALQLSENRLKVAQRIAKVGNFEVDLSTSKVNLSEGMCRIFELPNSITTKDVFELKELADPQDLDHLESLFINSIENETPFETEIKAYTTSGNPIYIYSRVEIQKQNGHFTKLFGTVQDITTLKTTQLKLEKSNKKYKDLFDNMYDAMLTIGPDGYFLNANEAAKRILEYSVEELKSIRISDLVHPDDRERSLLALEKLKNEGYYSNYEGRIITKSGKYKYVQVNSNAIIEEGKMVGSRDIVRDITALKVAEAKRELLYTQLEQANKELKDFAYIVSHDLKAPLRAISSLSNWIAEDNMDKLDKEGKSHLTLLTGRVKRMQKFIEGILQYSRIGRIQLEKHPVNITSLLSEIVDDLAPPKHFEIKIYQDIPKIYCEEIRIQQVFQNLISNAIKYNDKVKGVIEIAYKELASHHQFMVSDNGPGIDERYYERIFKIFQTLQARDQLESTGIGLTIVKRIVELHQGRIWLDSIPGEGSTFYFTIPKQ